MNNIIYSTDDGYADIVGISMISLLENAASNNYCIHVMDVGISENNKEKIMNIAHKYNVKCIFYDVLAGLQPYAELNRSIHIGTYARILVAQYLSEEIETALYIDADTIIKHSLEEIFSLDISLYDCAAVCDIFSPSQGKSEIGFGKKDLYFNAGILYLNLVEWRKKKLGNKCLQFLQNNPQVVFHDQDAINVICRHRILQIPLKYNMVGFSMFLPIKYAYRLLTSGAKMNCTSDEYEMSRLSPVILHFAGSFWGKPWEKDCHAPYKNVFDEYKAQSPWSEKNLRERKYAQNKWVGVYKRHIEDLCLFFYIKKRYVCFTIIYKIFYDNMQLVLAFIRNLKRLKR